MNFLFILFLYLVGNCASHKILGIFPNNGRSHHIYFSALVNELANRQHDVTVINYLPMQKLPTLHQISLRENENATDHVNIEDHLKVRSVSDLSVAYDTAQAFKHLANTYCSKLVNNHEVQELIKSATQYDVVIVEQFVTDCGLAIAYKLNVPVVGMTAHILFPWTYSRLGAPNHPAFVPNHFFGSGSRPNLFNRIKSAIINFGMNMYYTHVIQKSDQEIVNKVYPDTPLLEELGKNMSLIMLNQYFPLTSPRIYSSNVIEVGGMHITNANDELEDKGLQNFLDAANNDVIYISFGSVASNFPRKVSNEIIELVEKSKMRFVWKTDISDWKPPSNVFLGRWLPQAHILCHPNVVGFISHSGMLSTSEAIHCGVPIVSLPLFAEQFSNGQSAVECGLGVVVDVISATQRDFEDALETILLEKYQNRAKELSQIWKDRPLSPMDTAIFWIEYVARHKGAVNLKPPTVDLPLYQYLMIDIGLVLGSILTLLLYIVVQVIIMAKGKKSNTTETSKKKN